jgi:alkyl hydroperoxide reductase subunit AhpC
VSEFQKRGGEIACVSTDSKFSHKAWMEVPRNRGGIQGCQIPVLADFNKTMSRDYGVLKEDLGAAYRGLFLINPDGVVDAQIVTNLPVGRSVDEALRLIDAFQEAKKGLVCPANWAPGKPSINPKEASKYFEGSAR